MHNLRPNNVKQRSVSQVLPELPRASCVVHLFVSSVSTKHFLSFLRRHKEVKNVTGTSPGNSEPTYGLWMEVGAGRIGSSLLSVQAEAQTQVRVTSSSLQSEPKANPERPEVSCHRR